MYSGAVDHVHQNRSTQIIFILLIGGRLYVGLRNMTGKYDP